MAYPEFTTGSSAQARWEWDMRPSGGEPARNEDLVAVGIDR